MHWTDVTAPAAGLKTWRETRYVRSDIDLRGCMWGPPNGETQWAVMLDGKVIEKGTAASPMNAAKALAKALPAESARIPRPSAEAPEPTGTRPDIAAERAAQKR